MLSWIFGNLKDLEVTLNQPEKASGILEFARARVNWYLSVDSKDLPAAAVDKGKRTFRNLTIEGEALEFSDGFTDLHTLSYQNILAGNGFGIKDARPSVEIAQKIRMMKAGV